MNVRQRDRAYKFLNFQRKIKGNFVKGKTKRKVNNNNNDDQR